MRLAYLILFMLCAIQVIKSQNERIITDDDLQSGSYTWHADTTYFLEGIVYLEGGTLTIEPGTIIKARTNPLNGDPFSALIITAEATLIAQGKYMNPIIFSSDQDDIQDPLDFTGQDRGLWGGIVLLGNAPVLDDAIKVDSFQYPLLGDDKRGVFGGNQVDDYRGRLSNVSIRHAGASVDGVPFPGLSLAGVGNGTELDSVETFACAGDGFEFIGGTVDSRYLSSSFNGDDAFDWNKGFVGRGQFWFALQGADLADCGIEGKGQFSKPTIYNVTLIGSGRNSRADNTVAIRLMDQSAAEIGMSIFADFPNKAIEVEDVPGNEDSYAQLEQGNIHLYSNIWSSFGAGDTFLVENGFIAVSPSADDPEANLLHELLINDTNYIRKNYLPYIARTQNKRLYPDDYFESFLDNFYPVEHYPLDPFFEFYCINIFSSGHGAFRTDGAWWLRYWSALDQTDYLMHPCVLDFFKSSGLNYVGGDTIFISCEEIDNLPSLESYECINSKCIVFNQSLALAMRMKRKKRRLEIPGMPYCYMQSIVYQGYEDITFENEDGSTSLIRNIDTFEVVLNLLVVDTTAPVFVPALCDTCAPFPFEVGITDCDSAFITSFDSAQIDDFTVEYTWSGQDRCGNSASLLVSRNLSAESILYYEDLDQDGFGNSARTFSWQGEITGLATVGGDCDDQNSDRFPGNLDDPTDNFDNNCEGTGHHEICNLSERIELSSTCELQTFQVNPASLDYMDNRCTFLFDNWDGDLWFRIDAASAEEFDLFIDLESSIQAINVFQGSCDALELLTCSERLDSTVSVQGYDPDDDLYVQVALSNNYQGPMGICVNSNSITNTSTYERITRLKLYPNPTSQNQVLSFTLDEPDEVSLAIYNCIGQRLKVIPSSVFYAGDHTINIDMSDFARGTYWIMLEQNGFRQMIKSLKL